MANKKKQSFFWVSYSDLMTSLFFIMLLLFVLASGGMYLDKKATEEQLRKIEEIQEAVKQLPTQYFEEDKENHRWTLKKEFSPAFKDRDANIYALNDTAKLVEVGNSLIEVIKKLNYLNISTMSANQCWTSLGWLLVRLILLLTRMMNGFFLR